MFKFEFIQLNSIGKLKNQKIFLMKIICYLIVFLSTGLIGINAQTTTESWNTYIASYEDGLPGSTTLRMDLINEAPFKDFPFVLVTGINYTTSRPDRFPDNETFDLLYKVEDEVEVLIGKETEVILAGTFTFNKERLSYFYINDDQGLKSKIENFYKQNYSDNKFYLNIKEDKGWGYYKDFLYPNEETLHFMSTESVVMNLEEAGDILTKERRVDHWFYFSTKSALNSCKIELIKQKFAIESIEENTDDSLPFKLQVWKNDKVDMLTIYPITVELRNIAKSYNGLYDGWETFVIKE